MEALESRPGKPQGPGEKQARPGRPVKKTVGSPGTAQTASGTIARPAQVLVARSHQPHCASHTIAQPASHRASCLAISLFNTLTTLTTSTYTDRTSPHD